MSEGGPASEMPQRWSLAQNTPNPFNTSTTIRFTVADAQDVTLGVYNLCGQRVRTLVDGAVDAGMHAVKWDGRDEYGEEVSSGVCLYRLVADGGRWVRVRKMVSVR